MILHASTISFWFSENHHIKEKTKPIYITKLYSILATQNEIGPGSEDFEEIMIDK